MKSYLKFSLLTMLMVLIALAAPAQETKKVDFSPLLGIWALEVDAGGEFYYLTLELKLVEGKLEGGLSEQNGLFTNTPIFNVEFDGQTLKFDSKTPTPPDGAERVIKTEVKLVDKKLQGMITIADLGMSVALTGTKK
jgi:hypothetical protein